MYRRKFIAVTGGAAMISLAGCLGNDGGANDDPESVVVAFYETGNDLDEDAEPSEIEDEYDDILHSQSPIRGLLEFVGSFGGQGEAETDTQQLDNVETEILEEDVAEEEIRDQLGSGEGSSLEIEEETIEDIVDENALVEAEVSYENSADETNQHLVTKEDGDWVLFF